MRITITLITGSALLLAACGQAPEPETNVTTQAPPEAVEQAPAPSRFDIYASVQLKPDLSELSDHQREMISLLIDAAKITEDIFWQQVWGDRDSLLAGIDDPKARRFAEINYGPWDLSLIHI